MAVEASILIPTHTSYHTLPFAVASALRQTVSDIEVLIVGDGAPPQTNHFIKQLNDSRVRYFPFPKGERHGECYRHEVIKEAAGRIICYLSDDDLYLPGHVETMLNALENADFAASLTVWRLPQGQWQIQAHDLSRSDNQRLIRFAQNLISLSFAAHTLDFYNTLPYGWRTTPEEEPTDHYMWKQILDKDGVRAVSTFQATAIHFPSPLRRSASAAQRVRELLDWCGKMESENFSEEFGREIALGTLHTFAGDYARLYLGHSGEKDRADKLEAQVNELQNKLRQLGQSI